MPRFDSSGIVDGKAGAKADNIDIALLLKSSETFDEVGEILLGRDEWIAAGDDDFVDFFTVLEELINFLQIVGTQK